MKIWRIWIIIILLAFPYSASYPDGYSLLKNCEIYIDNTDDSGSIILPNDINSAYAIGYCYGVVNTHRQRLEYLYDAPGGYNHTSDIIRKCKIPEDVPTFELIFVLVKYLKENSDKLQYWEAGLLEAAFYYTYPCSHENEKSNNGNELKRSE